MTAETNISNGRPSSRIVWVGRLVMLTYLLTTLPLLLLFLQNQYFRADFWNLASHYASKVSSLETVHIGDSITAGGGEWGLRIFGLPCQSRNLATNGHTTRQIVNQVPNALRYNPKVVCVMSGTNDVFDPRFDHDFTISQYDSLLSSIYDADVQIIITLIPLQSSPDFRDRIVALNTDIQLLGQRYNAVILDLNPLIAPGGALLPDFTTDGVHFSEKTYDLWARRLRESLADIEQ